jgi:hypothetical protein
MTYQTNPMKKNLIVISCTSILICIILFFWKSNRRPTEFHKIEQFTKIWEEKSELFEVYAIPKPPDNLKQFKQEIYQFNNSLAKSDRYQKYDRLFIKEHDHKTDGFSGENLSYLTDPPAAIDNVDFLCRVLGYKQSNGKDTVEYHFFTSDNLYFYSE